jgi:hypothetical protein
LTGKKILAGALLFFVAAMAVFAGAPSTAGADDNTVNDGPHGVISASVESYAARVEYDIPLPAGPGSIAQVTGEIRASAAGENAKGIAAAPSAIGPVVGGKFSDPRGTGHPENSYPQTECFYPGALVDTSFYFPTDERGETKAAPAVGYATTRCAAGPSIDLHSRAGTVGGDKTVAAAAGPVLTAGSFTSDALARPLKGALKANTASDASNLSIMNGAITIASIVARGESQITGQPGGGTSTATIAISDISAGGVVFSLNSASINGKETLQLTVGGQTVPIDSSAAKAVIDAANTGLKAQGCSLAPVTSPDQYPQGFLFSRPEPLVGVPDDGSLAASYRGGLVVFCDIPKSLSEPSTFSPQRAQIVLGFAYTGTAVKPGDDNLQIGGFDTGDLLSGLTDSGNVAAGNPFDATLTAPPPAAPEIAAPAPVVEQAAPALTSAPATILPRHLAASTKWLLGLLSLALWFPLTHFGARRLRLALADGVDP